jgi:DNA-binding IclR family transcriptional regulator
MTATLDQPTPNTTVKRTGTERTGETPSAVLDRISLILDAFDGPGRLTLAQVVRRTGLPRSSAHRMLERLVQLRWLRRDGRDYELGMRLVELGSLAVHQDRLHRAAIPRLHELHAATGLVVHLAVLDGSDVVYLEKVGSRLAAAIPTRVGGRRPANCAAVGKAILAYAEDDGVLSGTGPLPRNTKYSISDPARLRAELAKVRAHGVAFDREESLPGIGCVAAPIGDPGEAVAAISVCGPMNQMAFDHRLVAPVRMAALGIWRAMEGARQRVVPTLQQVRPLRPGPTAQSLSHSALSHPAQSHPARSHRADTRRFA